MLLSVKYNFQATQLPFKPTKKFHKTSLSQCQLDEDIVDFVGDNLLICQNDRMPKTKGNIHTNFVSLGVDPNSKALSHCKTGSMCTLRSRSSRKIGTFSSSY